MENGATYYHYKDEIFRSESGDVIAFKTNKKQSPKYVLIGERAFLKMKGLDHEYLHLGLFCLISLMSLVTIIYYVLKRKEKASKEETKLRKIAFYLASTIVVFFLLLFILLDIIDVTTHYKVPLSLNFALLLPHVSALLALIFPYYVFKFIKSEKQISIKNIYAVFFMLLMLSHIWFFNYWEFLFYNI